MNADGSSSSCPPLVTVAFSGMKKSQTSLLEQSLLNCNLQSEYGLTMLFVSHDLAVVRQIADRVAVLYRGKLEEVGNTASVFDTPTSDYTQRLLAAIPGKSAA